VLRQATAELISARLQAAAADPLAEGDAAGGEDVVQVAAGDVVFGSDLSGVEARIT
jgi:hypothetical protein